MTLPPYKNHTDEFRGKVPQRLLHYRGAWSFAFLGLCNTGDNEIDAQKATMIQTTNA